MLKIQPEIGVDEITSVLELVVNAVVARVVESHTQCLLHLRQIEVIRVVRWGCGIIVRVYTERSVNALVGCMLASLTADVIDTAAAIVVVW